MGLDVRRRSSRVAPLRLNGPSNDTCSNGNVVIPSELLNSSPISTFKIPHRTVTLSSYSALDRNNFSSSFSFLSFLFYLGSQIDLLNNLQCLNLKKVTNSSACQLISLIKLRLYVQLILSLPKFKNSLFLSLNLSLSLETFFLSVSLSHQRAVYSIFSYSFKCREKKKTTNKQINTL